MMLKYRRAALVVVALAWALAGHGSAQPSDPADVFFDDSFVHEIRFTINTCDWSSLQIHYLDNTYYPADMRVNDEVVRNLGVRSRGTGSRHPLKPGLRVDMDLYSLGQ